MSPQRTGTEMTLLASATFVQGTSALDRALVMRADPAEFQSQTHFIVWKLNSKLCMGTQVKPCRHSWKAC